MEASEKRSPSIHKHHACWDEVSSWLWTLYEFLHGKGYQHIYGVPRGGLIPAVWLSHRLGIPMISSLAHCSKIIVVDDVVDTGHTWKDNEKWPMVTLVRKPWSPMVLCSAYETDDWVKFPWENR